MAQVWVDPGRLTDAARAVAAVADRLSGMEISAAELDSALSASLVAVACADGSRAAVRVVGIVAERLHTWSAMVEATLADVAHADAATARSLERTGADVVR